MEIRTQPLINFFTILAESLKLIIKNWKFTTGITLFSLIPTSILFFIFIYFIQSLITHMTDSITEPNHSFFIYWVLLLVVEIIFVLAFFLISIISNIALISTSAACYSTSTNLSLHDLIHKIKTTWRKQPRANSHISRRSLPYILVFGLSTVVIQLYPNPATICVGILFGILGFVYYLYLAVVWALAAVVLIVEDSGSGKEALERAVVLVEGKRLEGFFVNLFVNFMFLIVLVGYWLIMGTKGFLDLTVFGLFMVNVGFVVRVFIGPAYTVYYFQCKKHHGEEIESGLGGVVQYYTKLPTAQIAADIP